MLASLSTDPAARVDLSEKFVCVKVFCNSVAEEEAPRGPAGPFQFQYRSVPAVLIKGPDGVMLEEQFGMPDEAATRSRISQMITGALAKHGPIVPPETLAPILRQLEAIRPLLERRQYERVGRALERIETLKERYVRDHGEDRLPGPVAEIDAIRAAYNAAGEEALAAAESVEAEGRAPAALKEFQKIARTFAGTPAATRASEAAGRLAPRPALPR